MIRARDFEMPTFVPRSMKTIIHIPSPLFLTLLLVAGFCSRYCLVDLARAEQVRYLPQGAWAIICVISMPFGGTVYLMYGKVR